MDCTGEELCEACAAWEDLSAQDWMQNESNDSITEGDSTQLRDSIDRQVRAAREGLTKADKLDKLDEEDCG